MHSKLPTHTIQNHPALGRHNHKHHLMLIWLLFNHFNWLSSQVVCSVNYINCGRGSHYSLSQWSHDPSQSHSPCSILYMAQVCCHTASLLVLCIGCRMLQQEAGMCSVCHYIVFGYFTSWWDCARTVPHLCYVIHYICWHQTPQLWISYEYSYAKVAYDGWQSCSDTLFPRSMGHPTQKQTPPDQEPCDSFILKTWNFQNLKATSHLDICTE